MAKKKKKYLKESESYEMELQLNEKTIENRDLEILQLKKQALKDRKTILAYTLKNLDFQEIELQQKINEIKNKNEINNEKRKKYVEGIKKRLKISGSFGFNPDTLEITE